MLDRFQPSLNGSLHEQFLKLIQEDTTREYVGRFEALVAQLSGIPEPILEGNFIKGLKPELRTSMIKSQPVGHSQTIRLALLIDESHSGTNLITDKGITRSATTRPHVSFVKPLAQITGPKQKVTTISKAPFKRLTKAEIAAK